MNRLNAGVIALAARLEGVTQFYIPNAAALNRAASVVGRSRSVGKAGWKTLTKRLRTEIPKPAERIVAPAVKDVVGKVYTGPMHAIAAMDMPAGYRETLNKSVGRAERHSGYTTNLQPFVGHKEATQIARKKGWQPGNEPWRKVRRPGLHSRDLPDVPQ